jgi:hypothetical protein
MGRRQLERVRKIALALPDVNERPSHGTRCFFVSDKRPLCYFHDKDFRGDGRVELWCPSPAGVPEELVAADPRCFFRPTPSASGVFSDWLGVYLDTAENDRVDWREVAAILEDAFRTIAPKTLVAQLDAG